MTNEIMMRKIMEKNAKKNETMQAKIKRTKGNLTRMVTYNAEIFVAMIAMVIFLIMKLV